MIEYCKKYFFVKVHENWFDYSFKIVDLFGIRIYSNLKNGKRPPGVIKKTTHTIENSLDQDINSIYAGFSKNIRSGISKAEDAGMVVCFSNNVPDFVEFYNSFALKKKIPRISERRLLEIGENLLIGYASCDGRILAAHSYLIDYEQKIVRVFWACSARLEQDTDGKKPGWANKLLFYRSMIYFKGLGMNIYDWGGYALNTKSEELKGVNNFKKQFGGKIVACCNYLSIGYLLLHTIASTLDLLGNIY